MSSHRSNIPPTPAPSLLMVGAVLPSSPNRHRTHLPSNNLTNHPVLSLHRLLRSIPHSHLFQTMAHIQCHFILRRRRLICPTFLHHQVLKTILMDLRNTMVVVVVPMGSLLVIPTQASLDNRPRQWPTSPGARHLLGARGATVLGLAWVGSESAVLTVDLPVVERL